MSARRWETSHQGYFKCRFSLLCSPAPSRLPADPSAGPPCHQCLVVLSAFCALSGPRRDIRRLLKVRSLSPQRPPPLGAALEGDPGVSGAASQAGNPPSSASFWSLDPTLPELLLSSCPDLQHHLVGCADRAAMVGLTIGLRELRPLGWVMVWSASPRGSLAGFPLSLSRVFCSLRAMCQAQVAAPRGDPGDSGTQRGPPPPGSETGSPPISESFLNLYLLLALSPFML